LEIIMGKLLGFVGPVLRATTGGLGWASEGLFKLAGKADKNPNKSGIAALVTMAGGWFGVNPEDIASIGAALVKVGAMLQGLGG
jgi:hypothetical protein